MIRGFITVLLLATVLVLLFQDTEAGTTSELEKREDTNFVQSQGKFV